MFFDPLNINKNYAGHVLTLRKTIEPYRSLDEGETIEILTYLKLASIDHRRMILQLGQKHNIRLHYGACMSMVEIITTLYLYWLNVDPKDPEWKDRDRFILSKGHAAPSLYIALLQSDFVKDIDFYTYRTLDSIFQGHPDRNKTPGIDCSTGSLGQGLPVACGMAWALKNEEKKSGVYCLMSDGECNEGSVWEAALIAANAKLDNLVLMIDYNKKSSYGSMKNRNDIAPLHEKWKSFGWNVLESDGHDIAAISKALNSARLATGFPTVIIYNTEKGRGIPLHARQFVSSSSALDHANYEEAIIHLNNMEKQIIEGSGFNIR